MEINVKEAHIILSLMGVIDIDTFCTQTSAFKDCAEEFEVLKALKAKLLDAHPSLKPIYAD